MEAARVPATTEQTNVRRTIIRRKFAACRRCICPQSRMHAALQVAELFSFEPLHRRPLQLPVRVAFPDVLPFVELLLALADAEGNFHASVLPVERQRKERIALDARQTEKFADFAFVQQEFARRL